MSYHEPVMLDACLEGLAIKPEGIYVDVTFGGGGHSKAILNLLTDGKLFGMDQDLDAKANAEKISDRSFTFIEANFRFVKQYLKLHGIEKVDGLLADLGVSSYQIDTASRGFSTRFNADLDMRMDQQSDLTAKQVLNEYPEKALHKLFGMYGEVKNAKSLAATIVAARVNNSISTIEEFKHILQRHAPRGREFKYYAQVFQAIRIEVNDEMDALKALLEQSAEILKENGRLVVMSYHSLEDRMVKNFVNKGKFFGEVEKDFFGNILRPLDPINKKPIEASSEEVEINSRARSAKLRVAKKN